MPDDPSIVPARPQSLRRYLLASAIVTTVGLVAFPGGLLLNLVPLPAGTGPNIGAGLLALAGLVVAACGLVMLVVGGVVVSRDNRR
jgi:hypothetical protein